MNRTSKPFGVMEERGAARWERMVPEAEKVAALSGYATKVGSDDSSLKPSLAPHFK